MRFSKNFKAKQKLILSLNETYIHMEHEGPALRCISSQAFIAFQQVEREGRMKLPLKAQVVKPAQRIPRYELLIKVFALGDTPQNPYLRKPIPRNSRGRQL